MAKNFNDVLRKVAYFVLVLVVLVGLFLFIQPDDYIKYNSASSSKHSAKNPKKVVSQIQFLALKMKAEGFSEDEIIESFYHEYTSKLSVAKELKSAGFTLSIIQKYFKDYNGGSGMSKRKLTIEEYSRYLIEQDIKRFASFSIEERNKIRKMEISKATSEDIKKLYPKYEPNDEIKAKNLNKTGKSLREIKQLYPNYEPKK